MTRQKTKIVKSDLEQTTSNVEQEGLPNSESIVEEHIFVSPRGQKYRILKTTERDATDQPPQQAATRKRGKHK